MEFNQLKVIGVTSFLTEAEDYTIVDVRTPSEFTRGHIPGAVNIPLFSDNERARVGSLYKNKGEKEAIIEGLNLAGPRMSDLLRRGIEAAGDKNKLLVHCWRGGRRSASMAWLFSQADIECCLLEGGYKNYRNHVFEVVGQEREIVVVGGMTGSGKTDVLKHLAGMGEQVIDLEDLANHRGSAFGAIGMPQQPSTEQFANLLFDRLRLLDKGKRLFLEDESLNIGSVFMPDSFYSRIREAPVVAIMCSIETRMPRLLKEYGKMPVDKLIDSVNRIRKRLGGKEANDALDYISQGNMAEAIKIVLNYYDKSYTFGLGKRDHKMISIFETDTDDALFNAKKVIEIANTLKV